MKAVIQLCIYFCVLGFVVHAQSPNPDAGDAETQLLNLYIELEKSREALPIEREKLETAKATSENLESNRKASFWDFLFGTDDPVEQAFLDELAAANKTFIAKEQLVEKLEFTVKYNPGLIYHINANTKKYPTERVMEILADKAKARQDSRMANLPPAAKQAPARPSQK